MAGSAEGGGPWADWGNWAAAWAEGQQRLWQNWMAMAHPAAGHGQAGFGPAANWQDAQAQWSRLMQSAFTTSSQGLGGWFVEQWLAPLRLLGAFATGREGTAAAAPLAADWMKAFASAFTPFAAGAAGAPQEALMRGSSALWGVPMEMWRRLSASLSVLPGAAALANKAEGAGDPGALAQAGLEQLLSIPGFGYTREWQDQGQQAARDWLAYQRALGAYFGIFTRIAVRTGEVVAQRFAARATEGKPIQTLREAYDLFVDCAEDAYAEVVTAADFGKVSAELMNAAVALKRHAQAATEEVFNAANLPTRRELDTAHRQGQTLRRQLAAVQEELRGLREAVALAGNTDLEALRREVETLRAEFAKLPGDRFGESPRVPKSGRAAAASARAAKIESTEG